MRLVRLLLGAVGGVAAVLGILMAVVGALLLWAELARTDGDGFLTSSTGRLQTDARAIVRHGVRVGGDLPDWIAGSSPGTLRVQAAGADPRRPVFVGIGPAAEVDRYLAGVERDVVVHVDYDPLRLGYRREPGKRRPARPSRQDLWAVRVEGARPRPLVWDVADGSWAIVVMNADGSPGVAVDAELGARIGILRWLGVGTLAGGIAAAAAGAALVRLARRRLGRPPARAGADDNV